MTIQEAIQTLTPIKPYSVQPITPNTADAIKLGIEALKQVEFMRSIPDGKVHNLLPGETKE